VDHEGGGDDINVDAADGELIVDYHSELDGQSPWFKSPPFASLKFVSLCPKAKSLMRKASVFMGFLPPVHRMTGIRTETTFNSKQQTFFCKIQLSVSQIDMILQLWSIGVKNSRV
jgi:hypothetical protein